MYASFYSDYRQRLRKTRIVYYTASAEKTVLINKQYECLVTMSHRYCNYITLFKLTIIIYLLQYIIRWLGTTNSSLHIQNPFIRCLGF